MDTASEDLEGAPRPLLPLGPANTGHGAGSSDPAIDAMAYLASVREESRQFPPTLVDTDHVGGTGAEIVGNATSSLPAGPMPTKVLRWDPSDPMRCLDSRLEATCGLVPQCSLTAPPHGWSDALLERFRALSSSREAEPQVPCPRGARRGNNVPSDEEWRSPPAPRGDSLRGMGHAATCETLVGAARVLRAGDRSWNPPAAAVYNVCMWLFLLFARVDADIVVGDAGTGAALRELLAFATRARRAAGIGRLSGSSREVAAAIAGCNVVSLVAQRVLRTAPDLDIIEKECDAWCRTTGE